MEKDSDINIDYLTHFADLFQILDNEVERDKFLSNIDSKSKGGDKNDVTETPYFKLSP